ncbi:hypothetical protein [Candidatus Protochlamydia amoebophila]|nr:hypothetical protein [Candidatus Protochlamydia amoebophila]
MKLFIQPLTNLLTRIRYPTSLPEEVATDLGINISNTLNFQEFISLLTNPHCRPSKLSRFMPREQAENLFQTAIRKECFKQHSLFFYHFNGGWMEFMLQFDEKARLRRIYIKHKDLKQKYEISIS